MTRMLTRTNFHSSTLVRCLADLAMVESAEPENAFAEKLGHWIHFADAINLSALHSNGIASSPKRPSDTHGDAYAAAHAEFTRVQSLLANAITKSCSSSPGRSLIELPKPDSTLPLNVTATFIPYRRFYEAHQRDMDMSIQPLRFTMRDAVAIASPELKKLAELDMALEKILRERESKLLAKVPVLLKKRFEQLFNDHQRQLAGSQQPDNPATWMHEDAWLARFCSDMQSLLLAELELRLQPALGLLETLKQDTQ